MSLYNDLTTVLTPYANKIKQNESDIGDIQDTLEHLNVETDKTLSIDGKPADAKVVGDEIADLKSGFSGMTTATEKDVGKALKAKTVADGKVTEWEFGSVEVDTSLTKSGVPADASATGDAISKLNSYDVVTENEDITNSLIYGYYYRGTNVALGEKVNLQQVNNVNYSCGTIPVKRDDIYIITGRTRWDDTRVYCFVNNDYVLLEGAELKSELILVEEVVEAPSDGFLVINVRHGDAPKIQKRTVVSEKTLAEKIGELESETLAIESKKVSYPIDGEEIILPSKKSGLLINPDGSVEYGTAESATTDNGENMVKIPNIVVDPMFTDLSNTDAISIENAVCESDGDGVLRYRVTNATHSISIKVADSEETDVIYYSVRVAPKNNYVLVNARGKNVNIQSESEKVVGGIASGGVNKTIVISYGSRATMTNTVTMPIVVNLTKVFGAGHEPSYIEFTSIIESWGRDKFGTWISKQKYDYISGTPKLYAKNYFYNDSKYYPEYMTDVETTVTGDGASNRIRTIQTTFQNSFSIGDVVYFAVLVKSSGSPASLELCNVEASAPKAIKTVTSPLADTWYRLSAIMTVKSQYIPRYIEAAVLFADSSAQNGQTLTYKCGMCLNLTEVFGGGNEPTDTTVIDTMLTRYTNGWFPFKKSRDIWNPSIIKWLCEHYKTFNDGTYYGVNNGRFVAGSIIDRNSDQWNHTQATYGLSAKLVPVDNKFEGGIRTNGMVNVFPKYGRWERGAAGTNEGSLFGGHVFEAWNNIRSYRLTMMMGHGGDEISYTDENGVVHKTSREDEACIIVYSPADSYANPPVEPSDEQKYLRITKAKEDYYSSNSAQNVLGRIRIGGDTPTQGTVFTKNKLITYGRIILADTTKVNTGKALKFNSDGTVTWEEVTLYQNPEPAPVE